MVWQEFKVLLTPSVPDGVSCQGKRQLCRRMKRPHDLSRVDEGAETRLRRGERSRDEDKSAAR